MSIYFINPNIIVTDLNFKEIMDNMTNTISKLFVYNRNLIKQNNFNTTTNEIINILSKFLKIYKFYDYGKKNINIQIYNLNIDVIININFLIYKTFYTYENNSWESFYSGTLKITPFVYYGLDQTKRQELRISLINGDFYMYDNVTLEIPLNEGIILKKKYCACENNNNCNINYNYIFKQYCKNIIFSI